MEDGAELELPQHPYHEYESSTPCTNQTLDTSTSTNQTFISTEEYEAQILRDVRKFRIKYLCTNSFTKYGQYRKRRSLTGKGVILVLFLGFLERLAFWGALGNILPAFLETTELSSAEQTLIRSVLQNILAQLLYPVAGFLADVWLGRYKAIHGSLWVLWFGYSMLAFTFSFDSIDPTSFTITRYLLPVYFLVISVGAAGFQANMIPFGADQIIYTASEQLSSYFYWYYWTRNLAGITYILSLSCSNLDAKLRIVAFATLGAASITVALICNLLLKKWLFIDHEKTNPLNTVGKVICFAIKVRRPQIRSAFSVGRKPPPRIDLAKERHGGKFTNEQVEDVKTFLRLLVLLVAVTGVLVIYTGVTSVTAIHLNHMYNSFLTLEVGSCALSDSAVWTINVVTILISIPLLNQVVYPFLREYTPSMLKRIGLGYILAFISVFTLSAMEWGGHHQSGLSVEEEELCMFISSEPSDNTLGINSWWMIIPYTAINLTEVFVIVSCLEFLYAQSPYRMKAMMMGLFFFVQGLSATVASLFFFLFSQEDISERITVETSTQSCGFWYYMIFFVIVVVTFVGYILASMWYKNRQRGDLESGVFYRDPLFRVR